MDVEIRVKGSIEEALAGLRGWLVQDGFAFMETDRSYLVDATRRPAVRTHSASKYWARKQLSAPHPGSHALEVVGEVLLSEEMAVVRSRIVEYHGQREHTYGGSHALEDFVKTFCEAMGSPAK
jgi:hypothetical protein